MGDKATMIIGFLSLPLTGHLNPMTALGRKLQARGHEVMFIGVPDIEPVVRAADHNRHEMLLFANSIERHALRDKCFCWLTLAFNKSDFRL
jgi:UDP:flavonoid glycosyltransferase YjiC (YdhE family)